MSYKEQLYRDASSKCVDWGRTYLQELKSARVRGADHGIRMVYLNSLADCRRKALEYNRYAQEIASGLAV